MTVFVFVLVAALVCAWFVRRSRRRQELAGRLSERPTYQVEPPRRSVGQRKTERL